MSRALLRGIRVVNSEFTAFDKCIVNNAFAQIKECVLNNAFAQ